MARTSSESPLLATHVHRNAVPTHARLFRRGLIAPAIPSSYEHESAQSRGTDNAINHFSDRLVCGHLATHPYLWLRSWFCGQFVPCRETGVRDTA